MLGVAAFVGAVTLGVVLLIAAQGASATKDAYSFIVRGDVIQVDRKGNTITVYSRHTSADATSDLSGQTVEFTMTGAKVYKYNDKMQKIRTTAGSLNVGDEVVMRGNKRKAEHFNVSTITKNYHVVHLRGVIQGHDVSNARLEVDIDKMVRKADKASYRTGVFKKGERVNVYYDKDSTKFVNINGNEINPDEVANKNEKVTVEGLEVRYGSRLVAGPEAKVTDGKYTF